MLRFGDILVGRFCVLCGRHNTLDVSRSCRVIFTWQAQRLVQVTSQLSWQAQHFLTCAKCRCDESQCQGCVNVSKVQNRVTLAALWDVFFVEGGALLRGCRVSCGRRNTLYVSPSCRVKFTWQAQHLAQVVFQFSWQAQHFVTRAKCRCDESQCEVCGNVRSTLSKVEEVSYEMHVLELWRVKIRGSLVRNARFVSKFAEVSYEMLVLELRRVKSGGSFEKCLFWSFGVSKVEEVSRAAFLGTFCGGVLTRRTNVSNGRGVSTCRLSVSYTRVVVSDFVSS
eukprot:s119_g15.t1